jgi:uncharacterized protein YgbK (DUF1537 family)
MPYSSTLPIIGIIADDLTGANDTALQFHKPGYQAHILMEGGLRGISPADGHIWAFNTESRHLKPDKAVVATRRATQAMLSQFNLDHLYKKMDSTLRGNFAQECLAVLEAWGGECALIVPAFPEQNRCTVGGYQLVHGIPLEKSDFSRDPLCPVGESHIPTLIAQQSVHNELIGFIGLSTVMNGAGPILVALHDQIKAGKKLIVIDACMSTDLDQIALVIEKISHNHRVLPCGSAGLAKALSRFWSPQQEAASAPAPKKDLELPNHPILMLLGSNSETTKVQIRELTQCYSYYGDGTELTVLTVPPECIVGSEPLDAILNPAREALQKGNTVLVSTSYPEGNYAKTVQLAAEQHLDDKATAEAAQITLAKIADSLLAKQPARLIMSGGETSTQICQALNSLALSIVAEAEPAIPLLKDKRDRWLITKSGGLGTPLSLANLVQFLKAHEAAPTHAGS